MFLVSDVSFPNERRVEAAYQDFCSSEATVVGSPTKACDDI